MDTPVCFALHTNGRALPALALLAAVLVCDSPAAAQTEAERQVKAAFLYNFAKFIYWPNGAFSDERAPLTVGVLGKDSLGPALDRALSGKSVRGHPFRIQRFSDVGKATQCHVLFVCPSERSRLKDILQRTNGRPILTVSEVPKFAHQGGMINFCTNGRKVSFEVNPGRAKAAGLSINAQLLKLATIVG